MKTINLMGRDESGKTVLVSVTREEIDFARRQILAESGKKHISGSCLSCGQHAPIKATAYCEDCKVE